MHGSLFNRFFFQKRLVNFWKDKVLTRLGFIIMFYDEKNIQGLI